MTMLPDGPGADEAFQLLSRQSQNTNIKLRDIAAAIVESQHRSRDTAT